MGLEDEIMDYLEFKALNSKDGAFHKILYSLYAQRGSFREGTSFSVADN